MSDIKGLEPDERENAADHELNADADKVQTGNEIAPRNEEDRPPGLDAPHPIDGTQGEACIRGGAGHSRKKYIKIKKLDPLPPPAIKFKRPAPLRQGPKFKKVSQPKPGKGNPVKEAQKFHAAASSIPEDAAGQAESDNVLPAASDVTTAGTAPPAIDAAAAWDLIRKAYRHDPVAFAINILGVTPDEWQAEAMMYVGRGGRLLSVRAGHGVGKSAFCAWLVIWHMVVFFPQKTVLTAPTQGQLFDALFSEVKFWLKKTPEPVRELFEAQAERIVRKGDAEASFVSARTSSKEKPEALAGVHCEEGSVLLIADEASAIPEEVYEAATGSMSGRTAHTILISNPTRNSGLFHATHTRLAIDPQASAEDNLGRWRTMHVSCLGSKRADPAFAKQIVETYGLDSNQYRVRVLGEFATREDDVLIPAGLIDAATRRDIEIDPMAPLTYGLDIARFGDDRTVLVKRRGPVVLEIKWWSKEDTMATVGRIVNEAKLDQPNEICADVIGIGAGVCDRLRELGFNVRDVNVSEAAAMNPQANRLRDDLWLQVRDWFTAAACKIPDHDRLKADLKSPTYSFASNGKIVVEPKAMMKKRRLPSPDFADALCLTFAGDAAMVGGRISAWVPGKSLRRNIPGVV